MENEPTNIRYLGLDRIVYIEKVKSTRFNIIETSLKNPDIRGIPADDTIAKATYAVWKNVFKITYKGSAADGTALADESIPAEEMCYYGNSKVLPAASRKGYDFMGWYPDTKCTKQVYSIAPGSTGNKKLYGLWRRIV